jgi:hypothetical protein
LHGWLTAVLHTGAKLRVQTAERELQLQTVRTLRPANQHLQTNGSVRRLLGVASLQFAFTHLPRQLPSGEHGGEYSL